MSVEQSDVIDAIGLDKASGAVVLTISNHLSWDDRNILILQDKINAYLGFIEDGGLFETYPESKGRKVVVDVVCKYPLSEKALSFMEKIRALLHAVGVEIRFQVLG